MRWDCSLLPRECHRRSEVRGPSAPLCTRRAHGDTGPHTGGTEPPRAPRQGDLSNRGSRPSLPPVRRSAQGVREGVHGGDSFSQINETLF